MTERGRRRTSKWDLKEDSQYFQVGIREDNAWTGRAGESIQDAVSKNAKSDYNDIAQTVKAWDEDQSYNMSMSPGLDGWREQNRSRSPKSSSSRLHRSRSRSPPHGFRREFEGRNDRSRSGSRASTPPCKDFVAGRCRRGGHCRFLHHDIRNYEGRRHSGSARGENWRSRHEKGDSLGFDDSEEQARYSQDKASGLRENHYEGYEGNWEKHEGLRNMSAERCNNFLKGKCFKGSSCKYVHDTDIADDRGTRERAPYRRDRNTSFGHDYKREPDRTNNTSCKYFAAGNCLHGASCRFSHEGIVRDNLEGRSWDERRGQKKDDEKQSWHGPKWTDKAADSARGNVEGRSVDDMLRHNVGKQDSLCGGLKWGDQSVDSDANSLLQRIGNNGVKLSDNAEGRLWESSKWIDEGAGSDMMKSSKWSSDYDGGRVGSKAESASWGDRKWSQGAVDSELRKSPQRRNDSDGRKVGNTTCLGPTWSDKRADQDDKKSSHFFNDNTGGHIGGLDSIDHGQLLNAANMAYVVPNRKQYLHFINNEGTAQANLDSQYQSLMESNSPSHEQNAAREVSGQHQHTSTVNIQTTVPEVAIVQQTFRLSGDAASLPCKNGNVGTSTMKPQTEISVSADTLPAMVSFHGQSFNSNVRNEISQPLSSFIMNVHGQHVPPVPSPAPRVPGFDLNEQVDQVTQPSSSPHYQTSLQGQAIMMQDLIDQKKFEVTSRSPLTQNVVTSEQVSQITNLSASLAQIFGKGQQLPRLYATLNSIPTGLVPSIPNPAGPVVPAVASFTQSNQVAVSLKEYDPISDSVELSKSNISIQHPEVLPNSTEQSKIADQEAPTPLKSMEPFSTAGAINGGDHANDGSTEAKLHNQSQETKQFEPVANERADEHAIKGQDTVHLDDNDADGQNDEGDKKKDAKGLRMFKFALVESVKEILKPKWKEGQMSKEAHKTIVKKVVDKVISTFQGAHIPQTQEKIDHYLSYSKPKLTKLAQAYVEKYLKT